MSYNPSIHHRHSIRLKGYDYSQAGLYFVTLCAHDRACLFGHVENGEMVLNDAGLIAQQCWCEIPNHYPNVVLHEFMIMPNHVHGIVQIVSTVAPTCTIGAIVRGFKIGVTKWVRQNTNVHDVWQRNYYEHIIRNEVSYQHIAEYILGNPAKWKDDKLCVI